MGRYSICRSTVHVLAPATPRTDRKEKSASMMLWMMNGRADFDHHAPLEFDEDNQLNEAFSVSMKEQPKALEEDLERVASEKSEADERVNVAYVTLERCKMTLSAQESTVTYSPNEGVMKPRYPKFVFSREQFETMVGAVNTKAALRSAEGKVIEYAVIDKATSVHIPADLRLACPDGGFQEDTTMCRIIGVSEPDDGSDC